VAVSRSVDVAPERITRWIDGFVARHGEYMASATPTALTLRADDGAVAVLEPPFMPIADGGGSPVDDFVAHALASRRIGVLLVRLGGYAAGVFHGRELVASKVGSRPVHGRSAAGGWSQQRFARRREGQARVALDAAADAAVAVLLPVASTLDAVVTGGDRQALRAVLGDVRLAELRPLVSARVLDVPDPKARVLRESIEAALAVRVSITDPA